MIKLFSLKQQGKDGGGQQSQKSTAAFLRVQKGDSSSSSIVPEVNPFVFRFSRIKPSKDLSNGFP